jgi:hypothetical protein
VRVKTLGALSGAPTDLPSSQSVLSVIRGEPGGWGKVALSTTLRTLLIAPGMWFAGGKGWRLWAGAGAASATITVFLFFWYAAQEQGRSTVLPVDGALPEPEPDPALSKLFGRHPRRTS